MLILIYILLSALIGVCLGLFLKPVFVLYAFLILLGFIILHVLFLAVLALISRLTRKKKRLRADKFTRDFVLLTLDSVLWIYGAKIQVRGKENIPSGEFLLVCNHISQLDPIFLMVAIKEHSLGFVAKKEVLNIPIIGDLLYTLGCVTLDRDSAREALSAINETTELLQGGKCSMGIFPEGKTNRTGETLLPFKSGAFRPAVRSGLPVLACTIKGSTGFLTRFRSTVKIDILGTVETIDRTTQDVSNEAYQMMYDALNEK